MVSAKPRWPASHPAKLHFFPKFSVRNALIHNPANLRTLIIVISAHLFSLVVEPQFPDPACTRQALNCVRVLGRTIAILWEQSTESPASTAADILWEPLEDAEAPLADRLFGCTIDLLFCAGFTLPEAVLGEAGEKVNVSLSPSSDVAFIAECSLCLTVRDLVPRRGILPRNRHDTHSRTTQIRAVALPPRACQLDRLHAASRSSSCDVQ